MFVFPWAFSVIGYWMKKFFTFNVTGVGMMTIEATAFPPAFAM